MQLGSRCTTCGERVPKAQLVDCERCGRQVHEACEPYETTFECAECADELDVGAVEY